MPPPTTAAPKPTRPGLALDLPVAALMLGCWLAIALSWLHTALGVALSVMVVMHLVTRPGGWRWLGGYPRQPTRLLLKLLHLALLLAAVAMLVTGLMRLAGVGPSVSGHAAVSYLFLLLGLLHALLMVPRLRRRLRPRRP